LAEAKPFLYSPRSMGVDIFMYAERRQATRWVLAEPTERNTERDGAQEWLAQLSDGERVELAEEAAEVEAIPVSKPQELYTTRNRALFCILGYPHRRAHSATDYVPIAEPRGLPQDVSPEVHAWAAHLAGENSYPSWLLLSELVSFDWDGRTITKDAMVDRAAAQLFRTPDRKAPRRGFPFGDWPAGLQISFGQWKRGGVVVRWVESYAESAGREFLEESLPKLRSYGPPDDVRIVFWFG
jgi:hypothetical protein